MQLRQNRSRFSKTLASLNRFNAKLVFQTIRQPEQHILRVEQQWETNKKQYTIQVNVRVAILRPETTHTIQGKHTHTHTHLLTELTRVPSFTQAERFQADMTRRWVFEAMAIRMSESGAHSDQACMHSYRLCGCLSLAFSSSCCSAKMSLFVSATRMYPGQHCSNRSAAE